MPAISRRALLTRVTASRAGDRDAADRAWLHVHRTAMACRVEVTVPGGDARALAAARTALDEADRLEAMLTVFRDTSDLVRVNTRAALEPTAVPEELFEILQRSIAIHRATEGAFDISATPLSRCWGFLRREGRVPLAAELEQARQSVGMDALALDPASRSVCFGRPGVELNLGAIGKGYVLDRMASRLALAGIADALIAAGRSSIVALGGPNGGWRIDLRSRVRDDLVGRVQLRDAALGTSGTGEQFVEVNGIRYGHVIDPRTGWPACGVRSASVVAASGADADALSTAFLVGGADLAERYCASHPGVLAVVVPDRGAPRVFGRCEGASVELA
jgi:thiamine biosynthesis lipoprotein